MAALVLLVLFFSAFIHGSDGAWCVCRSDVSQSMQQKALDYACGAGADCSPILQNGGCYNPNTVLAHCSYAANSYFQRKGQAAGSCDFSATATVTATDPSYSGCSYPSSASTAGTASTTSGTPAGTATSGTPAGTFTPNTSGGVLGGLGPSGGLGTDSSANTGVVFSLSIPVVTMLAGVALLRLHW